MPSIALDIPFLLSGLALLVWARLRRREEEVQALCQIVATFWAQHSFGVSWSLARLVPVISAMGVFRLRPKGLRLYLPFLLYVVLGGLISHAFWDIPSTITFWYGEGRTFLQLLNYLVLAGSAMALSGALATKDGVRLLVFSLQGAAAIHGIGSIYQLVAGNFGLPLIGVSRAHGLTLDDGIADVAAFLTANSRELLRPGGFMGEPKTAAVLFGTVLLHAVFCGGSIHLRRSAIDQGRRFAIPIISAIGFVFAFSTSAYLGFLIAVPLLLMLLPSRGGARGPVTISIALFAMFIVGGATVANTGIVEWIDIIDERTVGRLDAPLDPPVEACLTFMRDNLWAGILGVGIGNSSFVVMQYLGEVFEYAYAPNILFILLWTEFGALGAALLILPFGIQAWRIARSGFATTDSETRTLLCISIASMTLNLAGSGMALGLPLAVACMGGAVVRANTLRAAWEIQQHSVAAAVKRAC